MIVLLNPASLLISEIFVELCSGNGVEAPVREKASDTPKQ